MQLFIKDFNRSSSTRVVAPSSPPVQASCLALTPAAATVVFVDGAPSGIPDYLGRARMERAIKAKNLPAPA